MLTISLTPRTNEKIRDRLSCLLEVYIQCKDKENAHYYAISFNMIDAMWEKWKRTVIRVGNEGMQLCTWWFGKCYCENNTGTKTWKRVEGIPVYVKERKLYPEKSVGGKAHLWVHT